MIFFYSLLNPLLIVQFAICSDLTELWRLLDFEYNLLLDTAGYVHVHTLDITPILDEITVHNCERCDWKMQ